MQQDLLGHQSSWNGIYTNEKVNNPRYYAQVSLEAILEDINNPEPRAQPPFDI